MHSKGPFFFFGAGGEGRILRIWVFLAEGAYWMPFFPLSAMQCVFFKKLFCIEILEKINKKEGKIS
jgi:hypothetical protein